MNNEEQKEPRFNIKAWSIGSVMHWLFPKKKYKTIDVEHPEGWSNCGVTTSNHFIADTNDSNFWDTLKFPLPEPKYKWQIKCYGGTLGREHNKQFVTLVDKPQLVHNGFGYKTLSDQIINKN